MNIYLKTVGTLLSLICILSSCKTYSEDDLETFDKSIQSYIKSHKLAMKNSPSGLYYNIQNPGTGKQIQYTNKVTFTYTGKLLDGTVFDKQTKPVEFELKELIGAWKEILLELKKGAKVTLISPPQLAYGDRKLDDIPQNSILYFEMEIIDVK